MICPHCRKRIPTQRSRAFTFESTANSRFKNAATAVLPPLRQSSGQAPPVSISHPIALPSMEANVHVPANQAIITGCLFAPVVGLSVYTIVIIGKLSTGDAILVGSIAGGIALFGTATWQWLTKTAFYDSLLQTVETELGVDLDGDGDIGPSVIKTEVRVNNNWKYADLPCDRGNEQALINFIAAVLAGSVTFSERGAISSGYNVDRFKELRGVFIKSGFAFRTGKTENSPIQFTTSGKALMRDVVGNPPPNNYELSDDRGMSANFIERGSRRESWSG